jgi:hypothetical protein
VSLVAVSSGGLRVAAFLFPPSAALASTRCSPLCAETSMDTPGAQADRSPESGSEDSGADLIADILDEASSQRERGERLDAFRQFLLESDEAPADDGLSGPAAKEASDCFLQETGVVETVAETEQVSGDAAGLPNHLCTVGRRLDLEIEAIAARRTLRRSRALRRSRRPACLLSRHSRRRRGRSPGRRARARSVGSRGDPDPGDPDEDLALGLAFKAIGGTR